MLGRWVLVTGSRSQGVRGGEPGVGHLAVASEGGVDAVFGPILGRGDFEGVVENGLVADGDGVELGDEAVDDLAARVEVAAHGELLAGPAGEDEGFGEDEAQVGKVVSCLVEEGAVGVFEGVVGGG